MGAPVDKAVLIPSVLLGLLLVAVYAFRCWRNGAEFNHGVMINVIFQASGIVCGVFLVLGIFYEDMRKLMSGIDIYIFISGLAVFTVSAQGFYRDAIRPTAGQDLDETANHSLQSTADASAE